MTKAKKLIISLLAALCLATVIPAVSNLSGTVTAEAATKNGVCKASDGNWYYYKDGKIQSSYTGFQSNSNGKWYIEKGKVTFKTNGVIKDAEGTIGTKGTWYYVVGSKVQTNYTGVANYKNKNGWWYIKNGKVDFSANTVAKNKNGWWYVKNGKVQFGYTGFGSNSNGKWYIENGKVTFNTNSVIKDTTGALGTKGTWYYVVGSKVQTNYTGVANYKNKNGWWYIKNSKVDFTFDGIASNKNGSWVVDDGKVDFSYNGTYVYNGKYYTVSGGKATATTTDSSTTDIGAAKAKAIALADAGLTESQVRDLEVEKDKEKGIVVYEVSFDYGNYEYDYTINATSGEIIEKKVERD